MKKFLILFICLFIVSGCDKQEVVNCSLSSKDVITGYDLESNYKIIYKTTNLYDDLENNYNINNVASEYEKKFHSLGKNINKVIFEILNPEIDNIN